MLSSIACLIEPIYQAGNLAKQRQSQISRKLKEDLSILTEIDQELDIFLSKIITSKFPEANLISEESQHPFDPQKPYTFTLDPIDGTDSYSQGMPGWCIGIGLLNKDLCPIAGIVYAPQWGEGKLLFADIGYQVTCNGIPLSCPNPEPNIGKNSQIMVHSYAHQTIDFHRFPGKVRNVGSGILHLCAPLLHCGVIASILGHAYIWDYTPGHAIAVAGGLAIEYWNGDIVDNYQDLIPQNKSKKYALCGLSENIAKLRNFLILWPQDAIH